MPLTLVANYVEPDYVADNYVYNEPPVTIIGPLGVPISYDYEAGKTVSASSKVYDGPTTSVSALGLPQLVLGSPGVDVVEGRDTLAASQNTPRTGDLGVTNRSDSLSADGSVEQVAGTATLWFNADWFNGVWFNGNWFNVSATKTGSLNVTEQSDTSSSTGHVNISGSANIVEQDDTTTTYGSAGIDVTGDINVTEARDSSRIDSRLLVQGDINVAALPDTLVASGPLSIVNARLSWEAVGGLTSIDIYRSTDNVNFTQIATVGGGARSYDDMGISSLVDYYYYLVGTTTIDTTTDPSSTVFLDISGN